MYKCSECGKVFNSKPEYCDCGNDEFISDKLLQSKSKTQTQNIKFGGNLLSLIIFFICLILSVIILSVKIKQDDVAQNIEKEKSIINKPVNWNVFEDNEKPKEIKIQQETPTASNTQDNELKVTKQPQQTKVKSSNPQKNVSKPVQQVKPSQKNIVDTQKFQETKKKAELENKLQQEKELKDYKSKLAKLFYYKIDFSNIIGSGSCEVSFKVNSSGEIVNKAFTRQSSNTTLNDTVYYAVKNVYRTSPPPKSYKGETLKLKVSFQNGNYSISLD